MAEAARHRVPSPEVPCRHCGLPVGRRPVGDDPYFCCSGCEVVYQTLAEAGLQDTYYRLREIDAGGAGRPARTATDDLLLSELDSASFLAEHTREGAGGTRTAELFLDGVHCAACVWLVERLPYEIDGIDEARLDLPRARLTLTFDPQRVHLSAAARWLARFGYQAHPLKGRNASVRTRAERRLLIRAGIAWALAGNIMLLALALYSGLGASGDDALGTAARWLSLTLAIPAVAYGGSEFFTRAWSSLRLSVRNRTLRTLHMDTPIALGIAVGFAHSSWATVTGRGDVWFDSIAVLIAALLTARWLQLRSRRLAGDAGERLLSLIPTMVRRRTIDGSIEMVHVDELSASELVEVPAGEVIPVDGTVISGTSSLNNAVLTGETRLEPVEPGSRVAAGSTNVRASLLVRVSRSGDETRLGRLLAWVREGDRRRAPVVLLADRLAGYFVATVLLLTLATAVVWISIAPERTVLNVVALLVITCPCALGMATPLAMAVASGKAARSGIFIKSDEAVQALSSVDCVVLDKTGTITEGVPAFVSLEPFPGFDADELLAFAARAEVGQSHPFARAIQDAAREGATFGPSNVSVAPDVEHAAGNGLHGRVDGRVFRLGRPEWVATSVSEKDAYELRDKAARIAERGRSPVALSIDGAPAGLFAFGDRIRRDAASTIESLRTAGVAVYLLSGDHPHVVADVAASVGLEPSQVSGGLSPEDKELFVRDLRSRFRSVVMVGDGVNDAAALRAAHVGVAVHGGSTVSLVAADVFLTREGVAPLMTLIGGSKHVMHVIRRNLGLSLGYNVLGAAAAMAGIVTPLIAAVAMPVSSLFVVLSSILQRSFGVEEVRSVDIRRPVDGSPVSARRRLQLPSAS